MTRHVIRPIRINFGLSRAQVKAYKHTSKDDIMMRHYRRSKQCQTVPSAEEVGKNYREEEGGGGGAGDDAEEEIRKRGLGAEYTPKKTDNKWKKNTTATLISFGLNGHKSFSACSRTCASCSLFFW